MSGEFTEYHDDLRATVRRLVGAPASALGEAEPPRLDWKALADAGLLGLDVPEALGGSGATFAEVGVVLEELGRAPAVGPFLGSAVLATSALLLAEPGPGRDELLLGLADGTTTAALALDARLASADRPAFSLVGHSERGELRGRAEMVVDAPQVDRVLCIADRGAEIVLAETVLPAHGLVLEDRPLVDSTRRLGRLVAEGVTTLHAWTISPGAVEHLADLAAIAVACDSLGLMRAMLDTTVAYATARYQFGRPIGSFQAVKHACADMLVAVEMSDALVGEALAAISSDAPANERQAAVGRAKSYVGSAAVHVCGKAMQLHGGIGYAWESGIHAYLKRATLNRSLFGSPADHRRRLMRVRWDDPAEEPAPSHTR